LSAEAKKEWRLLAPIAHEFGMLTPADLRAFELLCETLATGRTADTTVRAEGMTLSTASGSRRAHPAIAVGRDARAAAARMLADFGLTPKGRMGIDPAPRSSDRTGEGHDSLDRYLGSDPDLT
jgi:P27 family predicted phage terminase small subunit